MLQRYQHHSQPVQHVSAESECETESGSEEEEEEQEEEEEHALTQTIDARQCGSAVGGASSGPDPALDNYFAHLTNQYLSALALEGRTNPMSSCEESNQYKYNDRTQVNSKVQHNLDRYTGYAQKADYGGSYVAQKGHMVSISSKPSTPKIGKDDYGYVYYGNLVNNGRVGHVRNNNDDSRYTTPKTPTSPLSSRFKINKEKIESVHGYDEKNNPQIDYGTNYMRKGYYNSPLY